MTELREIVAAFEACFRRRESEGKPALPEWRDVPHSRVKRQLEQKHQRRARRA